jgi:hypothetical protein
LAIPLQFEPLWNSRNKVESNIDSQERAERRGEMAAVLLGIIVVIFGIFQVELKSNLIGS